MTWIKICGITNLEDARIAVDAGADALGFVFYEKSPRKIAPKTAREIVDQLPAGVEKVGVFVDTPQETTFDVFNEVHLTAMQRHLRFDTMPHSEEQKAYGSAGFWRPPRVYLTFPANWILADQERLRGMIEDFKHLGDNIPPEVRDRMPSELFGPYFLDASTADRPGGTGRTFDWNKAVPLVEAMRPKVKVVVAGGLNPANVGEAIRVLHPWGVDVASGVEARPGKKDPDKVRAFVQAVREAEKGA